MNNMENENSFEEQIRTDKIRKKIKDIKGFYKHLTVYLAVNIFLFIIKAVNLDTDESFFDWGTFSTAAFWGIGVFFHWYSVFGADIVLGRDWEERKIKEMMEKNKTREANTKKWE